MICRLKGLLLTNDLKGLYEEKTKEFDALGMSITAQCKNRVGVHMQKLIAD